MRLRTKKTFALLAYLAVEQRTYRRAELAALFWPDSDELKARTTLRSALADLRATLGSGEEYLRADRESLGLAHPATEALDLTVVRTAYDLARTRIGSVDVDESRRLVEQLRTATEACAGEFLEGFVLDDAPEFDHWTDLERQAWRTRLTVVLDRLSELLLVTGETGEAVAVAERWTAEDHFSEAAHRRLMQARYALGDQPGALRVYESWRAGGGHGVSAPEIAALAARIAAERTGGGPTSRPTAGRSGPAGRQRSPGAAHGPLVGRSAEFGTLVAELRATRTGGTRAVAVTGEAGIGKTRLVDEFLRWAVTEGADVLHGAAFEATEGLPYGPIVDALRDRLERERAPDDLLDDVWLAELSRLLPELRGRYPDLPPPATDEASAKARLFEAVSILVANLAARGPVVLFVDDLQWVDAATLDLLRYASHRWAKLRAPVLMMAAARLETPATRTRLAGRWAGFSPDVPLRRQPLGPLTSADVVRLVRTLAAADPADEGEADRLKHLGGWLHDETGGQPFFLTETLSGLVEQGVLAPGARWSEGRDVADDRISPGVREGILARVARLGPDASMLLAGAAVLGRHCGFEVLRQVVQLGEDAGLAALEEALASGLLREVGDDAYVCAHDKIRNVVYAEAGGARRRVYHRRALEVLQQAGASSAELARHALAAGAVDAAFSHSVAAAEEALAVFAVADAQSHFGRARTLLEAPVQAGRASRLGTVEERLGLYAGLGRIHEVGREWAAAQDAYERMLDEARRAGDRYAEWCTLLQLASLGIDDGNATEAELGGELRRQLRRRLDDGKPVGGQPRETGPDPSTEPSSWSLSDARTYSAAGLALAREMHRADLVAQSLIGLGVLEAYSGRWDRARSAAEEGVAICSRTGDRATEGELASLAARSLAMTGESAAAVRRMRGHPGVSGALGDREIHRADVFSMALALTETGAYEEALLIGREALDAARSVGYAPRLALNLMTVGNVRLTLFHLPEAREIYRELAGVIFPPEYQALVHANLCAVAVLAGDWEEGHAEALLAGRLRDEAPVQGTEVLHRHLEVEALLRGGSEELAREQLARFGAAVGGNRRFRLAYARALAVLRRHEGNQAAALELLDEARQLTDELGLPGERWQVEASLSDLHGELGDRADADRCRFRAARALRDLAYRIGEPELRQRFLSAAPVQAVLSAG